MGKAFVDFKGSTKEILGKKNGKDGYIDGEGAITAKVTVHGPKGQDDIQEYVGYTMSLDPEKFGVVADGIYDINYDVKGKSGSLKFNWALNKRGKVPQRGGFNPAYPGEVKQMDI